jgi:hypothetical protein
VSPLPKGVDDSTEDSAPVIDELEQTFPRPSPPGGNGPTRLPADSAKGQEARSGQTKPVWSDEKVEKLRALYPTHSASAIATQLGRSFTAVRSKSQNLGLKKAVPPSPREAKPVPKPKSLSAAVTADSTPCPAGTALPDSQEIPVRAKRPMGLAPCHCSIIIPINVVG